MNNKNNKVGFWAMAGSILAAAFGVQSDRNRERDFNKGNIWGFLIGGIIFTVIFIFLVILAVKLSLSQVN